MAAERKSHTRNRQSKIKQLPPQVRKKLDQLIREDRMSQADIIKEINALCEQNGVDKISQSGTSRYQAKMHEMMKDLRELREVSKSIFSELGEEPTGDLAKMVVESIRTMAAKAVLNRDGPMDPKDMNQLALLVQRLEAADMSRHKREKEIRQAFAEEAASKAEEALTNQGMTADTINTIKKEILGIA